MKGEVKAQKEDQHYLISPYKSLRFGNIYIHLKTKFTIPVSLLKSETPRTTKVCTLFRLTSTVLSLILSLEKMKW